MVGVGRTEGGVFRAGVLAAAGEGVLFKVHISIGRGLLIAEAAGHINLFRLIIPAVNRLDPVVEGRVRGLIVGFDEHHRQRPAGL